MNRRLRRRRARLAGTWAALLSVALLVAFWGGGQLISPRVTERVTAHLPATPETVWALLTDLDGMPAWRHDLASLERLPSGSGRVRWREVSPRGSTAALERVEAVAPALMVIAPAGREESGSRWVYRLERIEGGTELAIETERRVGNPFRRVLVVLFGGDRARMERLVDDVDRRLRGRRQQLASGAAMAR